MNPYNAIVRKYCAYAKAYNDRTKNGRRLGYFLAEPKRMSYEATARAIQRELFENGLPGNVTWEPGQGYWKDLKLQIRINQTGQELTSKLLEETK